MNDVVNSLLWYLGVLMVGSGLGLFWAWVLGKAIVEGYECWYSLAPAARRTVSGVVVGVVVVAVGWIACHDLEMGLYAPAKPAPVAYPGYYGEPERPRRYRITTHGFNYKTLEPWDATTTVEEAP